MASCSNPYVALSLVHPLGRVDRHHLSVTSQSNKRRIAASHCFTLGAASSPPS